MPPSSPSFVGYAAAVVLAASALTTLIACGTTPLPPEIKPTPSPTAVPSPAPTVAPTPVPTYTPQPEPALAGELGQLPSVADLVERMRPSVVSITTEATRQGLLGDYTTQGAGSGIIIRPEGLIATNAHVVAGARGIRVHLDEGATYDAEVVGIDRVSDLAVLRIEAAGLPHLVPTGSESLRVGDWVVAVGNAAGLRGGPTVTLGIVSGRGRTIPTELGHLFDMIQTDAAINIGNSGGPLIDLAGNVVGINTAIMHQAQGIGFAVSSSVAVPILDELIDSGRYIRPLIGMTGMDVTPALGLGIDDGVLIATAPYGGPAHRAGIRAGDVIIALDGEPTPDMAAFLSALWARDPGDEVSVTYLSGEEVLTVTVTLEERPQ